MAGSPHHTNPHAIQEYSRQDEMMALAFEYDDWQEQQRQQQTG